MQSVRKGLVTTCQERLEPTKNSSHPTRTLKRSSLNNTSYTLEEAAGDLAVLTLLCGLP